MTFFVVTRAGRHVLDKYLASWGRRFLDDVRVVTYGSLARRRHFTPGTWIFADLGRLSPAGRRTAARAWERMAEAGADYRLLNHPERSLGRFDLLSTLHARGVNGFRAHRLDDWEGAVRFPAFLRRESDHAGPRSGLLKDADELRRALAGLRRRHRDLSDWMLVEFETCADDAGFHRKYSSFVLDGRVLPRHVFFSRDWIQKWADLRGGSWAREELAYVEEAPHEALLRPIFELARIQYGRIDYSLGKEGLQVWEINTNPIILDPFDLEDEARVEVHHAFAERWDAAFAELCARTPSRGEPRWSPDRLCTLAHATAEGLKESSPGRRLRRVKHGLQALRGSGGRRVG